MTTRQRTSRRSQSFKKGRRRNGDDVQRRYENAWDDMVGYSGDPAPQRGLSTRWRMLRRFASTRSGRVVMLAPLGALGAYLLLRRRR